MFIASAFIQTRQTGKLSLFPSGPPVFPRIVLVSGPVGGANSINFHSSAATNDESCFAMNISNLKRSTKIVLCKIALDVFQGS